MNLNGFLPGFICCGTAKNRPEKVKFACAWITFRYTEKRVSSVRFEGFPDV
jgi:hypothetical protein